ncbi:MAG TPA: sugar phosphate isomerase/epimerase [Opitutaceae bacterium]
MKLNQVALQLYTLRSLCQDAAGLAAAAKRVRAIGYTAVQVSGVGPIPERELVSILHGEGLRICATHEPALTILHEPERVIDRLRALGCNLTAYPYPQNVDFSQPEQVDTLVRQLDAAGAKLRAAGITLGYHNHAIEFVKFRGAPVLEHIYASTQPSHLAAELDTYWAHYGGGDVVDWCRRLRGRLPAMHLKDYGFTFENKPTWCEIGAGTLPFVRIIAEAEAAGCEWFIVEQDTTPGDPLASVAQSFEYIKAHLVA